MDIQRAENHKVSEVKVSRTQGK